MLNKGLRPIVPLQQYVVFDAGLAYTYGSMKCLCNLTVYRKGSLVLGIAHEHPDNKGVTIGRGASRIWNDVKMRYSTKDGNKFVFAQGWNGVYEYVDFKVRKLSLSEKDLIAMARTLISTNDLTIGHDIFWTPAGTINDVLKVLE